MTANPFAALLRDVTIWIPDCDGLSAPAEIQGMDHGWVKKGEVLAALAAAVPADLAEAGKVLEGVTPGKWEPHHHDDYSELAVYHPEFTGLGHVYEAADANFIAWCREGVPALLARIAAMEARIKGLEKERDELVSQHAVMMMERDVAQYESGDLCHAIAAERAKMAKLVEALTNLPAVYAHQINTGVREVYDPLQRFYTMESVLAALSPAAQPGADVAAQALEAALSVFSGLSSYLGAGLGDDTTTAEQFDKRIRWAIDDLTARTRQAALREAINRLRAAPMPKEADPGLWVANERAIALLEVMIEAKPSTDAREAALLQRAAKLAYEVWDDPEALAKAILALGDGPR